MRRLAEVRVDLPASTGLELLRAAAYVMTEKAHVLLEETAKGYRVVLSPKPSAGESARPELAAAFKEELATQTLRLRITRANAKTQERLLRLALRPGSGL